MGGILVSYLLDTKITDQRQQNTATRDTSLSTSEAPSREKRPKEPKSLTDKSEPRNEDLTTEEATKPKVALVVDDLGWSRGNTSLYEEIDLPMTLAVLPGRPHSRELYERLRGQFEFILHFPMEPVGYPRDDPGKHALMTSMTQREVKRKVESILDRYPDVVGINNHMGSKFTQNRELMRSVMEVLKERDLLYLDSVTSANSVAKSVAERMNVPVFRNQVFLDNERSKRSIRDQFEKLIDLAKEQGGAIGIGHFQSEKTARVLRNMMSKYQARGIQFVEIEQLVPDSTVRFGREMR